MPLDIITYNRLSKAIKDGNNLAGWTEESQSLNTRLDGVNAELAQNAQQLSDVVNIPILKNKGVCIAHRGLNGLAPENTIPAFELAGQYGFWGIETDVRNTSDGELVLYHNTNLQDFTNGTGTPESHTFAEIQAMTFTSGGRIEMYPNTKLSTFEDYLKICRKYDMVALAECSVSTFGSVDKTHQLIYDYGMQYKTIFFTSSQPYLNRVRGYDKNIPLGFSTWREVTEADLDYCASIKPCFMAVAASAGYLTKEYVDLAHSKGVGIIATIVNGYKDYLNCLDWGVDIILSDHIVGGVGNV